MCEIQLIKRFDNKPLTKSDINDFANLLSLGNQYNKDAYGVFNQDGIILKNNTEFVFQDTCKELNKFKSDFLVGHNRFKTKGDAKVMDNNHPFETDNFIVVHNGVLSNDDLLKEQYSLDYKVDTDSYIISALLEHFYQLENHPIDKDLLDKVIKRVAEEIYGSFSVIVYCKATKETFYFKDKSTNFIFALLKKKSGDVLIGSTDKENIEIVYSDKLRGVFNKTLDYLEYEPDEEHIYSITDNGLFKLCKFTERTTKSEKSTSTTKPYWEQKTGDTYCKSSTLRGKLKMVADNMEEALKDYYKVKIVNRAYDFVNAKVTLETFEELTDGMRTALQDDFSHYGEISFIWEYRGNEVYKTKIVLDTDVAMLETMNEVIDSSQVVVNAKVTDWYGGYD